MRRYPYLMLRNGHYYFRVAVPVFHMDTLGRKELIYSLKTKDLAQAVTRCATLNYAVQEIFKEAHKGREVIEYCLQECLNRLDFKRDSSIGYSQLVSKLAVPAQFPETKRSIDAALQGRQDTVSQVFKLYIAECHSDRPKTLMKKEACLKLWLDIIGDRPVRELGKPEAREFKQVLMKLPSNMTKRYKGLSVKSILEKGVPERERLSIKSINHNVGYLRAFVNWMMNNGYYEGSNPFTGLALKEQERPEDKRNPFTQEQLKVIFSSPVYTGCKGDGKRDRYVSGNIIIKDSFYWIPLIALYSGARMQEICQLYVTDIKQIDGVWVFDINQNGEDKRLKTIASKRQTPIHPELIRLGLIGYAKSKNNQQRLFPDLRKAGDETYSNIFSKRFSYFLKQLGIKDEKTSFHSFRHTFIDGLREAGVAREHREALVGHLGNRTTHDNYGMGCSVLALYNSISLLSALKF